MRYLEHSLRRSQVLKWKGVQTKKKPQTRKKSLCSLGMNKVLALWRDQSPESLKRFTVENPCATTGRTPQQNSLSQGAERARMLSKGQELRGIVAIILAKSQLHNLIKRSKRSPEMTAIFNVETRQVYGEEASLRSVGKSTIRSRHCQSHLWQQVRVEVKPERQSVTQNHSKAQAQQN